MTDSMFPPRVDRELPGWRLVWFRLGPGTSMKVPEQLWTEAAHELRERTAAKPLSALPVVAAVRALFRQAGCDPTRYRPSSEALARRVLKGRRLGPIHPFVDLNNILSLRTLLPCCVMDPKELEPPFRLRRGAPGESMLSMRGPFSLEGKPVLADRRGPFGTPITDSERVKVTGTTQACWLVTYAPEGFEEAVPAILEELTRRSAAASIQNGPAVV